MKNRKLRLLSVGIIMAFMVMSTIGYSDTERPDGYLKKNIEVIVGWGPGGGTDTYMRAISIKARRLMQNPLIIINMPGASGAKAAEYVQQQPADGYTLWACGSNFLLNSAIGKTKYTVDDFVPVIRNQWDIGMIQVNARKGRFKTIQELIDYARKNPNKVTIGGAGAASFDEIMISMLSEKTGMQLKYIPYESTGKMHAAVLGGHLDAMFEEPGPTFDLIQSGALKPILIFVDERVEQFPDTPTVKELGYDITFGVWRGLLAKKGTPPEIVKYLHDVFKAAAEDKVYKAIEKERLLHLRPGYMNSEAFNKCLREEFITYRDILRKTGRIQ